MVLCFLLLLFCLFTLCSISCVFAAFLKIIIPFPMVAEMTELLRKSIWILSSIYFYPWKGNLFAFRSISFDIWFVLFHFTIFNTYLPIRKLPTLHITAALFFFIFAVSNRFRIHLSCPDCTHASIAIFTTEISLACSAFGKHLILWQIARTMHYIKL